MKTYAFSPLEKEMLNYDLSKLGSDTEAAKANIAKAQTAADVKTEICNIWAKVRPFIIWAEKIPGVGQYLTILFELLDSICGAPANN